MQVNVFDAQGNPATCYRCGRPATGYFNLAFNLASGAPDNMQPVCDEHMLFRLTEGNAVHDATRVEALDILDTIVREGWRVTDNTIVRIRKLRGIPR